MKRKDIIKALTAACFTAKEESRHTIMRHADGRWTVIPRHTEVTKSTTRQIEKQTGIALLC